MKALILAAGLGSRLKHLTADRPKALTLVNGRAILEHQLESLLSNDIRNVVIVVGYQGKMIIDFVDRKFPQMDVHYVWNREYAESNSSYSFWLAKDFVRGEDYLHLNCDIIFSTSLLSKLLASPFKNVIAIRKDVALGDQMENVVLDGDRITAMSIKHIPEAVGKAYGLAKLSKESTEHLLHRIERYLGQGDKNQNYYGMIREAVKTMDYHALDANDRFLQEINTLDDLFKTEKILSNS